MGLRLMRIIAKKSITEFCSVNRRQDAAATEDALWAWHAEVDKAQWRNSSEVKAKYRSASIVSNDRIVFNISGNKYRLVAKIKYWPPGIVWIRFIGTHVEYNKINAKEV